MLVGVRVFFFFKVTAARTEVVASHEAAGGRTVRLQRSRGGVASAWRASVQWKNGGATEAGEVGPKEAGTLNRGKHGEDQHGYLLNTRIQQQHAVA